jgi:hypothetical protein
VPVVGQQPRETCLRFKSQGFPPVGAGGALFTLQSRRHIKLFALGMIP